MGANIPLPALDVKSPQINLSQIYAQALQNKAARQEMQIRAQQAPLQQQAMQQQIVAGQQENQIRTQQIKDQQAMTQAMQEWDGKDYNQLPGLMIKHGASAQAVMSTKNSIIESQKSLAALTTAQLAQEKQKNDFFAQSIDNVKSLPQEQQAQAFEQAKADAVQRGYLKPEEAQGLQYQGPQQLDMLEKSLLGHSGALAAASSQASIAKTQAETAKLQQETQFGPTGPAAQAKYRFILQKKASGAQLSPDEQQFAQAYEASEAKTTSTSDTLGVMSQNYSKPAGLATVGRGGAGPAAGSGGASGRGGTNLSPSQIKNDTVDMIGQYRMDPGLLGRMLYKHPEMLGLIQAKYPDFDQTQYQAKNKMVQSYTSGPESKSINAIGTALGHVNELRDAIDALQNSDGGIKKLRDLGNKLGIQVGNDPVTAFNMIVHRVAPEITAAYVQGGGGEGERVAAAEDFSPSMSRKQLVTNWSETVKLLRSKIAQQEQQWNTTYQPKTPQDQFTTRFFSGPAKQALQRWSNETGNPTGMSGGGSATTVTAPNGKTYTFPDAASAAAFKQKAGIH